MARQPECASSKFPELFHYTTVPAFKNIYATQKFWATDCRDLNDSSELLLFRDIVREDIVPIIRKCFLARMARDTAFANTILAKGGIDAAVTEEAETHLRSLHENTFGERGFGWPFICSFCAHDKSSYEATHGLLSQWRGYGGGGGIAIVLDTRKIEDKMRLERDVFGHPINHIGDVTYKRGEVRSRAEFREFFCCLPKLLDDFYADKQPRYEAILSPFILGTTLTKHHAFHEENEMRIVVAPKVNDLASMFYDPSTPIRPIRYRQKGDGEVRYIELFGSDASSRLPIQRIIVGPSRMQNANAEEITDLISGSGIEVIKSETPFIG